MLEDKIEVGNVELEVLKDDKESCNKKRNKCTIGNSDIFVNFKIKREPNRHTRDS